MQKNKQELIIGTGFDIQVLQQKLLQEIRAMDYTADCVDQSTGILVHIEKDIGGMDTFLGRWQKVDMQISILPKTEQAGEQSVETASKSLLSTDVNGAARNLQIRFCKRDKADKLICFVIGPLFFAIPWIFGAIARSNRRNIEAVAYRIAADYAKKTYLEQEEALSQA